MERRLPRRTVSRKKYTTDAFEGIDGLQDVISDDDSLMGDAADDESVEGIDPNAEESPEDDEMSDVDSNLNEELSRDGSDADEFQLDEILSITEEGNETRDTENTVLIDRINPRQSLAKKGKLDEELVYVRALPDAIIHHVSKVTRRLFYYGPSAHDFKPVVEAKIKWAFEPTLPSQHANSGGFGGFHQSFFPDDDAFSTEIKQGQTWWNEEGGKNAFLDLQEILEVDTDSVGDYMPEKQQSDRVFVMGKFAHQQLFHLHVGGTMPLTDAWKPGSGSSDRDTATLSDSFKNGFMLNLGSRVHCLDWAPNRHGSDQYLAASLLTQREDGVQLEELEAPAFTPQEAHKANIQIWKFKATADGRLDLSEKPQLQIVLCTIWGHARELKWCHTSCEASETSNAKDLGLLAGIWADGAIRVLNITLPPSSGKTKYARIKRVAFESRPPNTVCTSLAWISNTRIAASCANGCIAVWSLQSSLKSPTANIRPVIYTSISNSYILSIAVGFPSRPHILFATSTNGFVTMTDLSRIGQPLFSHTSTATSQRARNSQALLAWHDFSQVALQIDDNYTLRGMPIRRLFATVGLGRYRSMPTSLASSHVHPFVLAGTAQGDVVSLNPTRRVVDGRSWIWQQTWFSHEWRRPSIQEAAISIHHSAPNQSDDRSAESNNINNENKTGESGSTGLTRITEGYKIERIALVKDDVNLYNLRDGVLFATVYEEKSSVTALACNPNVHVGGWTAAGMADGLLRVENIAT